MLIHVPDNGLLLSHRRRPPRDAGTLSAILKSLSTPRRSGSKLSLVNQPFHAASLISVASFALDHCSYASKSRKRLLRVFVKRLSTSGFGSLSCRERLFRVDR